MVRHACVETQTKKRNERERRDDEEEADDAMGRLAELPGVRNAVSSGSGVPRWTGPKDGQSEEEEERPGGRTAAVSEW